METIQISILNPKAKKLLQDLADLELISILKPEEDNFENILKRLREKAASNPPTLEEITEEVEIVRTQRYNEK
ncbi:hypothetical protein [Cognataquiflexum rubidum]|uniref:hypothetical protein n=1 Tax=Cognataquiflexum rubidum TaxID=2922273 RepID=UPI001F12F41C|nr:hypothetical protein [Cognataquiflexum rubidum]MCH6233767.1 hypothetical protein [Cognataquiflexum rubidum]